MRKLITLFILCLMMPVAFAAEEQIQNSISPDSPFYKVDLMIDDWRVQFAQKAETKARLRLEIAEERMLELQEMIQAENEDAIETARIQHEAQVADVVRLQNKMMSQERVRTQERFMKHIQTLERVQAQVPDEAKASISKVLTMTRERFGNAQLEIPKEERETEDKIKKKIDAGEVKIKGGKK